MLTDPLELFEQRLREAQVSLADAVSILDEADDELFAPPGRRYLMGKLDIALDILELELPEFKRAAANQLVDSLLFPAGFDDEGA